MCVVFGFSYAPRRPPATQRIYGACAWRYVVDSLRGRCALVAGLARDLSCSPQRSSNLFVWPLAGVSPCSRRSCAPQALGAMPPPPHGVFGCCVLGLRFGCFYGLEAFWSVCVCVSRRGVQQKQRRAVRATSGRRPLRGVDRWQLKSCGVRRALGSPPPRCSGASISRASSHHELMGRFALRCHQPAPCSCMLVCTCGGVRHRSHCLATMRRHQHRRYDRAVRMLLGWPVPCSCFDATPESCMRMRVASSGSEG